MTLCPNKISFISMLSTALALPLLLAGTVPARAAVSATDKAPDPCKLLSDAEASAILGKPAKGKAVENRVVENYVECAWYTDSSMLSVRLETDAILLAYKDRQKVDERFKMMLDEVKQKRAKDVTGLGAPAVWTDFHQLWITKPGRMIAISVNLDGKFIPGDDLKNAKAIAAKVLPRL